MSLVTTELLGALRVQGVVLRGAHQQRLDLVHDSCQTLGGSPLGSGFEHVFADKSLFVDVGVPDFCFEGDDWGFEGEAIEFELDFKGASLIGGSLGSSEIDDPESVVLLVDDVVPE